MTSARPLPGAWVVADDRPIVRSAVAAALQRRWPDAEVRVVSSSAGVVRAVDGSRAAHRIDAHASIDELVASLESDGAEPPPSAAARRVSRRQAAVRSLAEAGLTAVEIGQRLGISARTVEAHKSAARAAQKAC